jgi:hypothetical protein
MNESLHNDSNTKDKQTLHFTMDSITIYESEIEPKVQKKHMVGLGANNNLLRSTGNFQYIAPLTTTNFHFRNNSESLNKKKNEVYIKLKESYTTTDNRKKQNRLEALRNKINNLNGITSRNSLTDNLSSYNSTANNKNSFRISLKKDVFKPPEVKKRNVKCINITYNNKNIVVQNKLNSATSLLNSYFNTNIKLKSQQENNIKDSKDFRSIYKEINRSYKNRSAFW